MADSIMLLSATHNALIKFLNSLLHYGALVSHVYIYIHACSWCNMWLSSASATCNFSQSETLLQILLCQLYG